ncbi:MAG: twin-arginine translocase TatA/TatE family subunit [Wenzhouxiangellaceae bacterium]
MLGNIGPMQLLIIFLIVLLIFGTKKLRNVGGDLGSAIRDFRKGMNESEKPKDDSPQENTAQSRSSEDGDGDSDSGTTQPKP